MSLIDIESESQIRESWTGSRDIRECPIRKSWNKYVFKKIFEYEHIKENIEEFAKEISENTFILPSKHKVFNCFNACSFNDIKVVIIGQDPYHSQINQAQGFSFLVPKEITAPASLKNIIKEVYNDTNKNCGNLESWINQGVLLMNASLTVEKNNAGSHIKYWEDLTNEIIKEISECHTGIVFMLWGKFAESKKKFINNTKNHSILIAGHPSPLADSRNWFDKHHFSTANTLLAAQGKTPIEWGV